MIKYIFLTPVSRTLPSIGLLLSRLIFGGFMAFGHGLPKLLSYADKAQGFPDPLGIGAPLSMASAIAAELVCGILLMLGIATRVVSLPLIFTMTVAALMVHAGGPLFLPAAGAKEPALLYAFSFALFLFTGPGRFSLDYLIGRRNG